MPRGLVRSSYRSEHRRPAPATTTPHQIGNTRRRRLRHRRGMADGMSIKRPFTRDQRMTVIYGMIAFILILVILQLWLLTATMNAYLGGDEGVIWPAAAASV